MGIVTAAPVIVTAFRRGLYNKRAPSYNLYVDGEFIRYRGLIAENTSKKFCEAYIARTSVQFLIRLVAKTKSLMKERSPKRVFVFMDGKRVCNKVSRPPLPFDSQQIREHFMFLCTEENYEVVPLSVGEAELQMYLQRDRQSPLNIFITSDSDMVPICYGHEANVLQPNNYEVHSQLGFVSPSGIHDSNSIYGKSVKVLDSCLWVRCGKECQAFGFDFCDDKHIFSIPVFHTFIALCGTDFTKALFTQTIVESIFRSSTEDRTFINTLRDSNEIAAALLMLGIRGNSTCKRGDLNDGPPYNREDLKHMVHIYSQYITTGRMSSERVPQINMSVVHQQLVYALRQGNKSTTKKDLVLWANNTTLQQALRTFHNYLGDWVPVAAKSSPKKKVMAPIPAIESDTLNWRDSIYVMPTPNTVSIEPASASISMASIRHSEDEKETYPIQRMPLVLPQLNPIIVNPAPPVDDHSITDEKKAHTTHCSVNGNRFFDSDRAVDENNNGKRKLPVIGKVLEYGSDSSDDEGAEFQFVFKRHK